MRCGPQPAGDIHGEDQPAVDGSRQRDRGQCFPQAISVDTASGNSGIEATVPAAVFTHQRQPDQRPHRSVTTQHSIGQFEQHIRTGCETGVELLPEG